MPTTELMPRLPLHQIGGGKVFRPCTIAGNLRLPGTPLTAEDLAQVRPSNLKAMIDQRYIQVWPKGTDAPPIAEPGEVMIVPRLGANNRFDVVIGKRLNSAPLSKSEADALAKRATATREAEAA